MWVKKGWSIREKITKPVKWLNVVLYIPKKAKKKNNERW